MHVMSFNMCDDETMKGIIRVSTVQPRLEEKLNVRVYKADVDTVLLLIQPRVRCR